MKIDQIAAIFNLLNVPKVGPQKVRNLVSKFNIPENIFSLTEHELCRVEGIDQKSAKAIRSFKDFKIGEKLAEKTILRGITISTLWDKEYPQLLKKIYDPPVLLYSIGKPLNVKEDAVAIVGTRSATQYGKRVTNKLATELSSNNIVIVSGLARCIDTIAHTATVQNKQRTIAVLGSGLDIIYPSENWWEENTLLLPAQFLLNASDLIKNMRIGLDYKLISLWPINPHNGAANRFERLGLEAVASQPFRPYIGSVKVGNKSFFQAVYPDIAVTPACVTCHNAHPKSPKHDFKLYDVIGGIVVTVPMGSD